MAHEPSVQFSTRSLILDFFALRVNQEPPVQKWTVAPQGASTACAKWQKALHGMLLIDNSGK
mgnify:CR=1 FL=1|jgi:hypothetical protein